MAFESGFAEVGRISGSLQIIGAIASLTTTALLLRHRQLVDPAERTALLLLAGLIACLGLSSLMGGLQLWTASSWLLTAGQGVVIGLIGFGLWRLRRQIPLLRARAVRDQPDLSEQDLLTGLPDWQGFAVAFEHIRTYYVGTELEHTLLLVQAEGVRAMDHIYGTYAGDTVLLLIAQTLQDRTRTLDVVARVGEDCFGVLLAGCPLSGGLSVAETMRDAVAGLQLPNINSKVSLAITIGAAPFTQRSSLEACWSQAEQALSQAKQAGSGHVASPPAMRLLPLSVAYEAPYI